MRIDEVSLENNLTVSQYVKYGDIIWPSSFMARYMYPRGLKTHSPTHMHVSVHGDIIHKASSWWMDKHNVAYGCTDNGVSLSHNKDWSPDVS